MEYKYKNIKEMIYNICKHYSNKTAFIDIENKKLNSISYKQFLNDIKFLGTGLKVLFPNSQKVVLIGKNSYYWVLSFLTTMCSDVITIPLDKELSDSEIIRCINRVNADTIIYSDEFNERIDKIRNEICIENYISMSDHQNESYKLDDIIDIGRKQLEDGNEIYTNISINDHKTTELLFTSGTTDESKIVMLSHYNIISNAQSAKEMIKVTDNDVFFSLLPLHHTFENTCGLITPLCSGSTIVYNDSLKNILINIQKVHPTILLVVPRFMEVFYNQILKGAEKKGKLKLIKTFTNFTANFKHGKKLKRKIFMDIHKEFGSHLNLFVIGGATANPKISKFMRSLGFVVLQGYGLTECSPLVSVNQETKFKDDSVGFAVPNTEVCIDQPNSDGIGEIKIKGPQVMQGYYHDEKATKEVLKNGYFYTGDLGSIDHGFITIKGRNKNLILTSNGKNIYPEEIEEIINENDMIKESMIYQHSNSDDNRIKIIAEIVLSDEIMNQINKHPFYRKEIMQVIKEYINQINNDLPDYKRINDFIIREEEFEKTTTLKIKRYKIN